MEQWKDICGFEGYYQVSDEGNVRSLDRYYLCSNGKINHRRGKQCNFRADKDGYLKVKLSKEGVTKVVPVHRLVAKAFVSGYADGLEVDHKDNDRQNNKASNLRWVTHAENVEHCMLDGRHVCQTDISGKNNPNFGNRKLSERYGKDKVAAKEAQSRPRGNNGRAVPVKLLLDHDSVLSFSCSVDCAEHLIENRCIVSLNKQYIAHKIVEAAKNGKEYLGLRFLL